MTKFAFALLFCALTARAETTVLSSYFLPDASHLEEVSKFFTVEHPSGSGFEVEVPASQAGLLLALAPNATLVEADVSQSLRQRLRAFNEQLTTERGYHSFPDVQKWMQDLATAQPDFARVVDYGTSKNGLPLRALHLGTSASAGKPIVVITAATHGDELITTEVLIHLVDRLNGAYRKEDRLTKIVDNHDLYFIPVLNADGYTQVNRYDGPADPNRSYPYPGHEQASPTPSIAAVMKFFNGMNVMASIDFHAYGQMIMYPWAYTHNPIDAAPHARFDSVTKNMAESNQYTYGPIADVIYIAPGSSCDYYFWTKGTFSLGIEIGEDKIPPPEEFPNYFASQEESTWRFLEAI